MCENPVAKARVLVGRAVRACLAAGVVVEGQLVDVGASGDFTIEDDAGVAHYCWPLLDIEET